MTGARICDVVRRAVGDVGRRRQATQACSANSIVLAERMASTLESCASQHTAAFGRFVTCCSDPTRPRAHYLPPSLSYSKCLSYG